MGPTLSRHRIGEKKVLSVPLQRPSDTSIKYYAGDSESFEKFLKTIDEIASILKSKGWIVLCKKHPLEADVIPLEHAEYVPDDTHFMDLIKLSDTVVLINSGVGLYAMMSGKPCYIFGKSFYAFGGLNQCILKQAANEISGIIVEGHEVDMEGVRRFIHYLTSSFYSFAVPITNVRKEADGSLRNETRAMNFYEIRLLSFPAIKYQKPEQKEISTAAPLLERFRLGIIQKRIRSKQTDSPKAAALKQVLVKSDLDQLSGKSRKMAKLKNKPYDFLTIHQTRLSENFGTLYL